MSKFTILILCQLFISSCYTEKDIPLLKDNFKDCYIEVKKEDLSFSYLNPQCFLGKSVEYLKGEDTEGNYFDILKSEKELTFINLWFAECQPCINEIPQLNLLKEEFEDKVEFISVCRYEIEKDFIKEHAYNFRHLKVDKDSVEYWFPNVGYPTNYIVDKNTKIIHVCKGFANEPDKIAIWRDEIKKVIYAQMK